MVEPESERPGGSEPEATLQVQGLTPPLVLSDCEYPEFASPFGSDVVVTDRMLTIVIGKLAVPTRPLVSASVSFTVKELEPTAVGVPESAPAALKLTPVGSEPNRTVQRYGVVPFVACRV